MEVAFMTDGRGPKNSSVLGWMISIWKSLETVTKCYKPPAIPFQNKHNKHFSFEISHYWQV